MDRGFRWRIGFKGIQCLKGLRHQIDAASVYDTTGGVITACTLCEKESHAYNLSTGEVLERTVSEQVGCEDSEPMGCEDQSESECESLYDPSPDPMESSVTVAPTLDGSHGFTMKGRGKDGAVRATHEAIISCDCHGMSLSPKYAFGSGNCLSGAVIAGKMDTKKKYHLVIVDPDQETIEKTECSKHVRCRLVISAEETVRYHDGRRQTGKLAVPTERWRALHGI